MTISRHRSRPEHQRPIPSTMSRTFEAGMRGQMTYLDRGLELEEDGLGDEDLAGLGAKITDLGLEKLDLLAWAAASHLE